MEIRMKETGREFSWRRKSEFLVTFFFEITINSLFKIRNPVKKTTHQSQEIESHFFLSFSHIFSSLLFLSTLSSAFFSSPNFWVSTQSIPGNWIINEEKKYLYQILFQWNIFCPMMTSLGERKRERRGKKKKERRDLHRKITISLFSNFSSSQ